MQLLVKTAKLFGLIFHTECLLYSELVLDNLKKKI